MKPLVHVAAACDEGYAMPLAAMIASLAANLSASHCACVHVLQRPLPVSLRKKVENSVLRDGVWIDWIDIASDHLHSLGRTLRSFDTVSLESYYRLLLPDVLPPDLEKVIYLDSDLVVHHDLSKLWELNVENTPLLAVPELSPTSERVSSSAGIRLYRELGLPPEQKMFNSGVMLINLSKWRHEHVSARAFIYLDAAALYLRWHDQEALNAVLAGEWTELDPRWNVTMHAVRTGAAATRYADLIREPYIVHFNSACKPWQPEFALEFRNLFYHYLDGTSWKGWRPVAGGSLTRKIGKRIRRAVQKRTHAAGARLRLVRAKLVRWSAATMPPGKIDRNRIPTGSRREVRAFIKVVDTAASPLHVIAYYRNLGVDRLFLLVPRDRAAEAGQLSMTDKSLHVFTDTRSAKSASGTRLRSILSRYGQGHWCALVDSDEMLYFPHAGIISLDSLCNLIEASGSDAMCFRTLNLTPEGADAVSSADPASQEESIANASDQQHLRRDRHACVRVNALARDPVTERVFPASLLVSAGQGDRQSLVHYCSKVALFRYHRTMSIAENAIAIKDATLANIRGALLRSSAGCLPCPSSIPGPAMERILAPDIMQTSAALEDFAVRLARF